MPTPLSCRSSSALDSLPRNANARRSGTALHRLQQQRSRQTDELGFWKQGSSSGNGLQLIDDAGEVQASGSAASPRRMPKRFPGRQRKSSKATKHDAISSGDLPLASSDLYSAAAPLPGSRDAFSDGEDDFGSRGRSVDFDETSSIRIVGHRRGDGPRPRTLSLSPQKLYQPILMPIQNYSSESDEDNDAKSIVAARRPVAIQTPSSPSKRQQSHPARKRIITKEMIGKPTNFQHTGHIGAGAYGGVTTGAYDEARLKQQLSEVAAALRLDDHASISASSRGPEQGSEITLADDEASTVSERVKEASAESQERPFDSTPAVAQAKVIIDGNAGGMKRTTSKRKPVPAPRKLCDLYSEFSAEAEGECAQGAIAATPLPQSIVEEGSEGSVVRAEQENVVPKPIPTIRASNGKRLVEGPSGAYITETANVRWNKALNEITLALKDESGDADGDDEEEDVETSLARADTVLRRLNAI